MINPQFNQSKSIPSKIAALLRQNKERIDYLMQLESELYEKIEKDKKKFSSPD